MGLVLIAISVLLSIVETTIVPVFLSEYRLNLVLVFWMVLTYLLSDNLDKEEKFNFPLSFFAAGFLFDFLSGDNLGIHALIFLICGMSIFFLKRAPFRTFIFHFPLSLGITIVLYETLLFGFYILQGKILSFDYLSLVSESLILNLILSFGFFPLLSFILTKMKMRSEIQLKLF